MAEVVSFSKSLYALEGVEAAARAYSDLARIVVEDGETEVRVTVSDPHPDFADQVLDAFCNHALFETIVRTRGAA